MKQRCYYQQNISYKYYGARGITICKEWLADFTNFYNWAINNGYQKGLSIDRINVNGNYEPSNCRWVNMKIQANNRTSNHYITIGENTKTIMEWSEISGIDRATIWARLMKYGWNEYDAVFKPVRRKQVSA